ncbi:ankyrin repeat domain-containing protein [Aspergillus stella-maris]|uniref:ankyrin repeat domain-containing protein n=1 Tax=Aspergillus stella-maris TaxID=1810926 RepID=UPI003CCCBB38
MRRGHEDLAILLLENGADAESLDWAGHQTPLTYSVHEGLISIVRKLIQQNVDAQPEFTIPILITAAQHGYAEVFKLILDDVASRYPESLLFEQYAALDSAAYDGNTEILRILLDRGSSPDGHPDGRSPPLHTAIENNHYQAVRLILNHGANLCHDTNELDIAVSILRRESSRGKEVFELLWEACRAITDMDYRAQVEHILQSRVRRRRSFDVMTMTITVHTLGSDS